MELNALSRTAGIALLVAVNIGLALLFHNEESGFSWFFGFLALSIFALAIFSFLLSNAAKRHLERSRNATGEKEPE